MTHAMTPALESFIDTVAAEGFLIWNPDWTIEEVKANGVQENYQGMLETALSSIEEFFPDVLEELREIQKTTKYGTMYGFFAGDMGKDGHGRISILNVVALLSGAVKPDEFTKIIRDNKDAEPKLPFMYDAADKLVLELGKDMVGKAIWKAREEGVAPRKGAGGVSLPRLPEGITSGINALLSSAGVPHSYKELQGYVNGVDKQVKAAEKDKETYAALAAEKARDAEELKKIVAELSAKAMAAPTMAEVKGDGTIPDGRVVSVKASDVFPGITLAKDFDLPAWEWDGDHPEVPKADPHYVFRPTELARVLYALVTNQRAYLHGHTGTGKTTLLEQVAARLNWPFLRINFDSEITRMDLIGRDTLKEEGGKTISKFVDGILPKAMSGPYITCFDELDFVRPDVAYVMQSALEGNALRITEDGDRTVTPHPMYRMFGTGNTVGQGDEHGMYAGARPQSLAFLDRFAVWVEVDYLKTEDRDILLKRHFPSLTAAEFKQVSKYTTEHINAFKDSKVIQPLSPRGMLAIARATVILGSVSEAVKMTVIDRASGDDKATLKGIMDRVIK